jgi:hypothetical protein
MKSLGLSRYALAIGVASALLAGCGGSQPSIGPFQSGVAMPSRQRRALHPTSGKTWIAPDAGKSKQILFVSDYNYGTVEMFSVPGLKLKGVIGGFYHPQGLCSDAQGNVWVANSSPSAVVELSHTGKVLQEIQHLLGNPASCAVDPKNGNLAVTILDAISAYSGVEIYTHASGSPTVTGCLALINYFFVGYDNRHDLYVDGPTFSNRSVLCSGKDTGAQLSQVRVRGVVFRDAAMVQWYQPGRYLALGDQTCAGSSTGCIYKVAVSGNTGSVIGATKLLGSDGQPACVSQAAIAPGRGMTILGGAYPCGSQTASVNRWHYPLGGLPIDSYENREVVSLPVGSALSVRP